MILLLGYLVFASDSNATALVAKARAARLGQDSSLQRYEATSRQRASAGIGVAGRDRLVYRSESVAHIQWARASGARVTLDGVRTTRPLNPAGDAGSTHKLH
jgi:hypothetical protein